MRVACVKTEVACVAVLNAGHFGLCSKKLFMNTANYTGRVAEIRENIPPKLKKRNLQVNDTKTEYI